MFGTFLFLVVSNGFCGVGTAGEFPQESIELFKSEDFRVRENAQSIVLEWSRKNPEAAMERLFVLSQSADDPEVRERCLTVLRTIIIDEYLTQGEGYIGIRMQDETGHVPGDPKPRSLVRILEVVDDSPSDRAGLKANDLIAGFNDEIWREEAAVGILMKSIRELKPGNEITLSVLRDGRLMQIKVKLARRPVMPDNPFFMEGQMDIEAAEKASKESYFRRWMDARKARP